MYTIKLMVYIVISLKNGSKVWSDKSNEVIKTIILFVSFDTLSFIF